MHLKNKPQGYVSAFASHGDPAYSNPPIKMSQVKQQETLLGANLKSFIKERLFGNFINYTKLYNARKYNFTPPISTLTDLKNVDIEDDPMKSAPSIRENYKHRINDLRTNIEKKIHERYNNGGEKNAEKTLRNRLSHRNSLGSNIQQSTLLNSQRSRIKRSNLGRDSINGSRLDKNHSYDFEKYPGASFISAIEDSFQQSSKPHHSGKKQVRLSPLNNKTQLISKLEKVKNQLIPSNIQVRKNPNRIETEKFDIIDSVWELFCQPIKSRSIEKIQTLSNNSYGSKDYQNVNESFISNIHKTMDNRVLEPSKNNLSIEKSKFSLSKTHFTRQSFLEYLNNTNQTYPPLANLYCNFYEMNPKLYDELKIEQYKTIVENIVSSGPRVWAVSSFRFWDINQDGFICSNDIFAMYQILDAEETRLKDNHNWQNNRGYKTVKQLKAILQDLRQIIIEVNFDLQLQKKRKIKSERSEEDKYEIKYLEEALLRKKQLKYSDLILVLGHNIKTSANDVKKSVIDTAKEINMKYSSCYRYSFLATDHNEQTRQDRQHIENLKQHLRREKMEITEKEDMEVLEKGKILGINYKTYHQKEISLKIRTIILDLFAIKLH